MYPACMRAHTVRLVRQCAPAAFAMPFDLAPLHPDGRFVAPTRLANENGGGDHNNTTTTQPRAPVRPPTYSVLLVQARPHHLPRPRTIRKAARQTQGRLGRAGGRLDAQCFAAGLAAYSMHLCCQMSGCCRDHEAPRGREAARPRGTVSDGQTPAPMMPSTFRYRVSPALCAQKRWPAGGVSVPTRFAYQMAGLVPPRHGAVPCTLFFFW